MKPGSTAPCYKRHMQGFNLYLRMGYRRRYEIQYLYAGRLRLFLTICHTRRIMPFWLLCLIALVGLLPAASRPRADSDQKFTWQYGDRMEARARRFRAYDVDSGTSGVSG